MSDVLRVFAAISNAAWKQIDEEARRTRKRSFAVRKLVDVAGLRGLDAAAVGLGRVGPLANASRRSRMRRLVFNHSCASEVLAGSYRKYPEI
jgi:uncharacterized linocin/CFP29 family protein